MLENSINKELKEVSQYIDWQLMNGSNSMAAKKLLEFSTKHELEARKEVVLFLSRINRMKIKHDEIEHLSRIDESFDRYDRYMHNLDRNILALLDIIREEYNKKIIEKPNVTNKFLEVNIDVPELLKIPLQQYLIYFNEFVKVTKETNIEFEVQKTELGLEISIIKPESVGLTVIQEWLNEYISLIKQDVDNLKVNTTNNIDNNKFDLLIADLKNQIAHLKNSIEILKLKNRFLEDENHFVKKLNSKEGIKLNTSSTEVEYDKIKKLVAKGNLSKALESLANLIDKTSTEYNEVLQHLSKISILNLQSRQGVITDEFKFQEFNKISKSILEFIDLQNK